MKNGKDEELDAGQLAYRMSMGLAYGVGDLIKNLMHSPADEERAKATLHKELYENAVAVFYRDKQVFLAELEAYCDERLSAENAQIVLGIARRVWELEEFDIPKPPLVADSIEGARYRDNISKLFDLREVLECFKKVAFSFSNMVPEQSEGVTFDMTLSGNITGKDVARLASKFYEKPYHFPKMRAEFDRSVCRMSGLPYEQRIQNRHKMVWPQDYEGSPCVAGYLSDNHLAPFLEARTPLSIDKSSLFEHVHILGATGSGKTQLLQKLIIDLAGQECSIIVIDSQSDMIQTVLSSELIDRDRLVHIDPTDVEYPLALNIFDVGQGRMGSFSKADYERHMNGVIDLIVYVLSSILDTDVTQKQGGLLKYLVRLLIYIPNATLLTLKELLMPNGVEKYREYMGNLSQSAQNFFVSEFNDAKVYGETKKQILWRLYGLLENPTIERMFTTAVTRFSMKEAMDSGKVVLINTAKEFLKQDGCSFFGRFFISLIAQSAQERSRESYRKPTFVIIDEAQDYLDTNIGVLLEQSRKYNVGLILAHQHLAQIPNEIQQSLMSNTSTKMVGGASHHDARLLAHDMHTTVEVLTNQKKLNFALYSKGLTEQAVSVRIEAGVLEDMPKRSRCELEEIRSDNRKKYAYTKSQSDKPTSSRHQQNDSVPDDDIESFNKA